MTFKYKEEALMTASERLSDIRQRVEKQGTVLVKTLAIEYRVTEDLIRKDLKKLEKLDVVDRIYGGAERKKNKFQASTFGYRLESHVEEKEKIATKAVKLIRPGNYIFLDTSSTSYYIAKYIALAEIEVTVITDMLAIVVLLSDYKSIKLISIGGEYDAYTGGFFGPVASSQIHKYKTDLAFISCKSISVKEGYLLEGFAEIGNQKKIILDNASKKVLATQKSKYNDSGVYRFYELKEIDIIITEDSLEMNVVEQLKELKINIF